MKNRSEQEAIFEDAAIEVLVWLTVAGAVVALGVWWLA